MSRERLICEWCSRLRYANTSPPLLYETINFPRAEKVNRLVFWLDGLDSPTEPTLLKRPHSTSADGAHILPLTARNLWINSNGATRATDGLKLAHTDSTSEPIGQVSTKDIQGFQDSAAATADMAVMEEPLDVENVPGQGRSRTPANESRKTPQLLRVKTQRGVQGSSMVETLGRQME